VKHYPAYKDSGVASVGAIPRHWEMKSLKQIANVRLSGVDKHSFEGEIPVRLCNYNEVYGHNYITPDLEFMRATASESEVENFSLCAGDVVITKDSESWKDIGVPAFVPKNLDGVICGYHLALIRPRSEIIQGEFLFRAFSAPANSDQFNRLANGITRYGLSKYAIANSVFPVPPQTEQSAIVSFLDRKLADIDLYIANKQKQIELLQERKNITIRRVVVRGVNPNAKFKSSGIEWLGDIPSHWEIQKTKHLFKMVVDNAPENNSEELLSVYTDIGVKPRKELEERGNRATTTDGYLRVEQGDIIVNKLLAWMGAIGVSHYSGVTSPAYDVLRRRAPLNSDFYHHLFRCGVYLPEFKRRSRGIMDMRLRLYFDEFGQIPLVYPPEQEQTEIVNYIESQFAETDIAIAQMMKQIERMQEFRTALIAEAVTGKIDVRN